MPSDAHEPEVSTQLQWLGQGRCPEPPLCAFLCGGFQSQQRLPQAPGHILSSEFAHRAANWQTRDLFAGAVVESMVCAEGGLSLVSGRPDLRDKNKAVVA